MTNRLRRAIEVLIDSDIDSLDIQELKNAYTEQRETTTATMGRIEYLEECLESGLNKRAAARKLIDYDPHIGQRTAETLVYTAFSGMYQNPRKKRRSRAELSETIIEKIEVAAVDAEADLL